MTRGAKLLDAMRLNPRDWRIEDVATVVMPVASNWNHHVAADRIGRCAIRAAGGP